MIWLSAENHWKDASDKKNLPAWICNVKYNEILQRNITKLNKKKNLMTVYKAVLTKIKISMQTARSSDNTTNNNWHKFIFISPLT